MENNIRVNVVSPGLVEDSAVKYKDYFPGYEIVKMKNLAELYERVIKGEQNGEVFRIYN